jgi:aconitate hydratase 2/2-methylisocitrate dehydratase
VADGATVLSTSTRNFPNRLGTGANVYLCSAELAAVGAVLGRIPTIDEYLAVARDLDTMADEVYRYLNFDELPEYTAQADNVEIGEGLNVVFLDRPTVSA